MSQITVMNVVVLAQAGQFHEAVRLIYDQPMAIACDLVSKSVDLLSRTEWTLLQKALHVPATVIVRFQQAPDSKVDVGSITIEPYVAP